MHLPRFHALAGLALASLSPGCTAPNPLFLGTMVGEGPPLADEGVPDAAPVRPAIDAARTTTPDAPPPPEVVVMTTPVDARTAALAADAAPPPADDPSLVAHWTFDTWSGNTALDSSKNRNDAVLRGASMADAQRAGRNGKAALLNGSSYFTVPRSRSIDAISTALSVSVWVNVPAPTNEDWRFLVSRQNGSGPLEHFGLGLKDGKWAVDSNVLPRVALPNSVPPNTWVHLAAVWTSNVVHLYMNGSEIGYGDLFAKIVPDETDLVIGGNRDYTQMVWLWTGFIDELRIYSRALSSDEIAALAR